MNDTVKRIMGLADEYAMRCSTAHVSVAPARQALQDELTLLFTPLTDEILFSRWQVTPVLDNLEVELDLMDYRTLYKHFAAMHGITGEKNEAA